MDIAQSPSSFVKYNQTSECLAIALCVVFEQVAEFKRTETTSSSIYIHTCIHTCPNERVNAPPVTFEK